MSKRKSEVSIDSLLDRYINPIVERASKPQRDSVVTTSIPKKSIPAVSIPATTTPSVPVEPPADKFVRAGNWLWDSLPSLLSPTEWVVYAHLYRLTVGFNRSDCVIGYGGLAERTGLGKATVVRHVARLRELGLLATGETTQTGTEITLLVPTSVVTMGIPKTSISTVSIPDTSIPTTNTPGVVAASILTTNTPDKGQRNAGVVAMSILTTNTNKYKGTDIDNNKQDVVVLLSESGYDVTLNTIQSLADAGVDVSPQRIRECIAYIKRKRTIKDKDGALVAALKDGWNVGESARESAAAAEESRLQQEAAAREEEAKAVWLAAEKERLGQEGLARLREEVKARAEAEGDYVLKRSKNEKARADHISGLVDTAILARYGGPS
jgi:hypothetical protein